jgi:hypothetical protein
MTLGRSKERRTRATLIGVLAPFWALAIGSNAFAKETQTYCDDKCGDTTKCVYTCCFITTDTIDGIPRTTELHCSFSLCGAQGCQGVTPPISFIKIPPGVVVGVAGPLKWQLSGLKGLDASSIAVESDAKTKTITIHGTVRSAAQRDLVDAIAKKQGKGYKIVNQLRIEK